MYDLIDQPVAMLPHFERTVLDRTRRWVHAFSIAGGVETDGMDDPFARTIQALDRGSADDIVIQRPCFATVDEPEAVILSLWRLVRDGQDESAWLLAGMLVDAPSAIALIDGIAETLATL